LRPESEREVRPPGGGMVTAVVARERHLEKRCGSGAKGRIPWGTLVNPPHVLTRVFLHLLSWGLWCRCGVHLLAPALCSTLSLHSSLLLEPFPREADPWEHMHTSLCTTSQLISWAPTQPCRMTTAPQPGSASHFSLTSSF
jgi:hypothetical protein